MYSESFCKDQNETVLKRMAVFSLLVYRAICIFPKRFCKAPEISRAWGQGEGQGPERSRIFFVSLYISSVSFCSPGML